MFKTIKITIILLGIFFPFSLPLSAMMMAPQHQHQNDHNLLISDTEEEAIASRVELPTQVDGDVQAEQSNNNQGSWSDFFKQRHVKIGLGFLGTYAAAGAAVVGVLVAPFVAAGVAVVGAVGLAAYFMMPSAVVTALPALALWLLGASGAAAVAGAAAYYAYKWLVPYLGKRGAALAALGVFFALYCIILFIIRFVVDRHADKKRKEKDTEERDTAIKVDITQDSRNAFKWFTAKAEKGEDIAPKKSKQKSSWSFLTWIGVVSGCITIGRVCFLAYSKRLNHTIPKSQPQRSDDSDQIELQFVDTYAKEKRNVAEEYLKLALADRAKTNYEMQTALLHNDAKEVLHQSNAMKIDMKLLRENLKQEQIQELLGDKEKVDSYHSVLHYLGNEDEFTSEGETE